VTVTVYTPGVLTVALAPVAVKSVPLQLKVTPAVVELLVSRTVGWMQVIWAVVGSAVVVTPPGGVIFCVTVELADAVQPLTGFVAVKV
jgi:hypothetical protein